MSTHPHPCASLRPVRPSQKQVHQRRAVLGGVLLVSLALVASACTSSDSAKKPASGKETRHQSTTGAGPEAAPSSAPMRTSGLAAVPKKQYPGWVDPASSGEPWSSKVEGLLTFRGNPTRSNYGLGPMPKHPKVQWTFPTDHPMCGSSSVDGVSKQWCGTGWTGEPAVWEKDGRTWLAFGAYDKAVHVLDAKSGERILPDFPVGDIIKGSVTIDPDGLPILYTGGRDNYYRAIALDRPQPLELWKLWSEDVKPTMWNNDWDGSGLVIDDYLFEGGENSQFHIVKLNRAMGPDGKVTMHPQLVFHAPGWDDQLLRDIGDHEVSIENSVAISGNTVYFANSGGLVQGWDIAGLKQGRTPTRAFRFWTGDDTDASVVIDKQGFLYVASEYQRHGQRARDNGQIMKLDPRKPDNPLVWSVPDHDASLAGVWATPAVVDGMVHVATNGGRLLGIDAGNGRVKWQKKLPGPTWQSAVVVDGVLLQGDCDGVLHAYDVSKPGVEPKQLWSVTLGGCIESTPAVWKGRIYVGTRAGRFFAIGDS